MTTFSKIPYIAIIPAKNSSQRCPGKNTREFDKLPLFMHSVHYAMQEGVTPVVSTDCDEIKELCRQEEIICLDEKVDDSTMVHCINQVLSRIKCDVFSILQPTSPFRKPGLLRRMLDDIRDGKGQSALTVQKIKMIGFLDGVFHKAYREQDQKRFFYFFDGNLLMIKQDYFLKTNELFDDHSLSYVNELPCCLQIDDEIEFAVLNHLTSLPDANVFLPKPTSKIMI